MKRGIYLKIEYFIFDSMPEKNVLNEILQLHKNIFGTSDDLINKMATKPQLLVITAMDRKKVIGYKSGYELYKSTFYSWLGGVDPNYRGHGIASTLMDKQHQYLRQKRYKVVQTKTMNRWRNMLVLNIKNGFDVINTYTDDEGVHKMILEKKLLH